jgi:hypothetical protein
VKGIDVAQGVCGAVMGCFDDSCESSGSRTSDFVSKDMPVIGRKVSRHTESTVLECGCQLLA